MGVLTGPGDCGSLFIKRTCDDNLSPITWKWILEQQRTWWAELSQGFGDMPAYPPMPFMSQGTDILSTLPPACLYQTIHHGSAHQPLKGTCTLTLLLLGTEHHFFFQTNSAPGFPDAGEYSLDRTLKRAGDSLMVEGVFKKGPGKGADWGAGGVGSRKAFFGITGQAPHEGPPFLLKKHKFLSSPAFKATQESVGQHSQVLQLQVWGPNRFRSLAALSALLSH